MDKLVFETVTQAAIFEHELKGQISDGHWENDPQSDWRTWCNAKVLSESKCLVVHSADSHATQVVDLPIDKRVSKNVLTRAAVQAPFNVNRIDFVHRRHLEY